MTRHQYDLFAGMRRPPLPDDLKVATLAAARAAANASSPLTDRLWESQPLRLAWAAAVVLLLGVQLFLAAGLTAAHRDGVAERHGLAAARWPGEPHLTHFLKRHRLKRHRSLPATTLGHSLGRFVEPSGASTSHDPTSFGGSV